ncbi:MAG: triose-phosphate isomerase [Deltaproteobacteria bacterium]|nr:triose-phosphate isomerase [Deltaproteobacteria bacterium]MBW2595103.1 triose-phosphate isomerase [Deltaproteobacteria bacterium]MBW2649463.1 triose-phosphate isomerase [Deltaproteobacteria bacterium]
MINPIIAANWKMHKTIPEAVKFAKQLKKEFPEPGDVDIVVAPPFTALRPVMEVLKDSPIHISAQNMHWEEKGAYTGEISTAMLVDAGCEFVIIGHSERRTLFGETDGMLNRKIRAALKSGLKPIFCIGETLEDRESGTAFEVIQKQIKEGLNNITSDDIKQIAFAYEPVWAIGTGKTATPLQAQEAHRFIRETIATDLGYAHASKTVIIYGGSVNPENTGSLMDQPDINGALVGGAGLDFESFAGIIKISKR